ncbi:EAL domain-containing protein (putative c-di-GMP-specific phosphodiesterase class I) [Paraburkholderia sp. GAS199]|uniref:EAL domain-containing protein n=1 Tax=Paraburkholderia sp. GAS199 TaxID=3035126 RepID=UPI003D1EDBF5
MHTLDYDKTLSLARTLGNTALCADWAVGANDAHDNNAVPLSDLETRVRDGLRAGEFHLVFQGTYRANDSTLARVEAQVRWTHPEYGLLLPGIFLMPIDDAEVALEVATFVVEGVCRELRDCLAAGLPVQPIAITVPAPIAILDAFATELMRLAREYGVPATLIDIEVADSADAARLLSLRTLTAGLRDAGVGISIGNWGNGASSLAMLGVLDVDTVGVARELMASVPRDPRACVVMTALLDMLRALDVRVVVSGVETEAQLQWLRAWPDLLVQGFAFPRANADLATLFAGRSTK